MSFFLTCAIDDRCLLLVDPHALAAAEHLDGDIFKLDAEVLGDHLAAVRIAMSSSIALRRSPKPWRLDSRDLQSAAQLVDDERRERLTLDVFRDDQKRLSRLHDRFENGEHALKA